MEYRDYIFATIIICLFADQPVEVKLGHIFHNGCHPEHDYEEEEEEDLYDDDDDGDAFAKMIVSWHFFALNNNDVDDNVTRPCPLPQVHRPRTQRSLFAPAPNLLQIPPWRIYNHSQFLINMMSNLVQRGIIIWQMIMGLHSIPPYFIVSTSIVDTFSPLHLKAGMIMTCQGEWGDRTWRCPPSCPWNTSNQIRLHTAGPQTWIKGKCYVAHYDHHDEGDHGDGDDIWWCCFQRHERL